MDIELLVRWLKPLSKEQKEKEEKKSQFRELGIPFNDDEELEDYNDVYEYLPMTFPLEDVRRFWYADKEHTVFRFADGEKAIGKIDYVTFQSLRKNMLGRGVIYLDDLKMRVQKDY